MCFNSITYKVSCPCAGLAPKAWPRLADAAKQVYTCVAVWDSYIDNPAILHPRWVVIGLKIVKLRPTAPLASAAAVMILPPIVPPSCLQATWHSELGRCK
jgi:hypothetical protein